MMRFGLYSCDYMCILSWNSRYIHIYFDNLRNCSIINAHNDLPVDVICKGKVEPTKRTKLFAEGPHLDIGSNS